jgi:thiamine pyrophosphate-dependent acetolactate synthase large subunit-like protein
MMQGQGSKGALRPYRVWGAPMYGSEMAEIHGHAGEQTIAAVLSTGTEVMFTLNGGHIWPFYEAARNQGMRVVDTRHEQTATFAAEAYAKLTRRPGLAVLTAGPGITNGVSAITSAHFNGSPLLVLGGASTGDEMGCRFTSRARPCADCGFGDQIRRHDH